MNRFFGKGRRGFAVGSLLAIVVAILHTMGLSNEPIDENWASAEDAMRAATMPIGSMTSSLYDVFVGAWIQIGVLLALLGVKNLVVLSVMPDDAAVARRLSIVDAITYAGLAGLFAVLLVPPPLVAFAVLAIVFLVAALTARATA